MGEGMKIFLGFCFVVALLFGWGANVYRLAFSDFERPYAPEVSRLIGVFVAPVGVILGYMDLEGE